MASLKIRGDLVLPDRVLEDRVVCVEDGRIHSLGDAGGIGPADHVLDCRGSYIAPGFVDIHVHGADGADYMDGHVEAVRTANRAHLRHGTTSIFPTTTTGSFEQLDRMVKACETVRENWTFKDGARIEGIHFYGPYFASDKVGVHARDGRRDPVREEYEYFLSRDIIRIATCAAELPGASDFYAFARSRGCFVTCGHSNAEWSEMEEAFARGMRHVDHFWCAMSSVSSLRPRFGTPMRAGMEQFVIARREMSTEVIADGMHLSDDLLRFAHQVIGPERTCLVTDSNRAMDAPPGQYRFGPETDGTMVYSDGQSVRGKDGSLASSMHGMDRMVRTMASAISSLPDAIRMASLTPAERVGLASSVGSLEPGKRADIVVLSRDLAVEHVLLEGVVVDL